MTNCAIPTLKAGTEYSEIRFESLICPDLDLTRAEFSDCVFRNCRLPNAILQKTRFERCLFDTTDLSNAKVSATRFVDCSFRGSKALGVDWTAAQQPLFIKAVACNFGESNFQGLNLSKLSLTECLFHNADFEQAKLKLAKLANCDFTGARFNKTDLSQADLRGATNYNIDPRQNLIRRAHFSIPEALSLLSPFEILLE